MAENKLNQLKFEIEGDNASISIVVDNINCEEEIKDENIGEEFKSFAKNLRILERSMKIMAELKFQTKEEMDFIKKRLAEFNDKANLFINS